MGGFGDFGGYDFGNVASSLRADLPETPWVLPATPAYSLDIPRVSAETPGLGGGGDYNLGNVSRTLYGGGGGGGEGGGDWWSKLKSGASTFGDVARAALPFASLGATGVGIASSIQARNQAAEQNKIFGRAEKLAEQTAGQAAGAAAPLTQFGSDALAKAQRGEIPAPMQAMIDQWKQGAKAQMHEYLASIGQGDSQALAQMDAEIDKQGVAMAAQMLQQEISQGAGALTGAAGALTGAGQVAGQVGARAAGQTGDLERLIFEANRQLAAVTGAAG